MNWKKLVLIQSAMWGLIGSLFFCWGTIFQSEEKAQLLSGTYYGGNTNLFDSLLTQRVDYTIGTILIALAFFSQLMGIIKDDALHEKKLTTQTASTIIIRISGITILVALIFRYAHNAGLI